MSQFPCLAAVPPENIDASIVSCQFVAHWLSQVCWQTHCGPTLRTTVQFHQAVTQHIFQEGHKRRFVRSGFPSCVTVWSHKPLCWHSCGNSKRHQGKQHLWHKLSSCWAVGILYFSVRMASSGQKSIICANSKILLIFSHSTLPGLLLAAFWHKVWS